MSETALSVQPEVMRGSLLMQVLQQKLSVWQPMKKDLVPVFWEFTMRKRQRHFLELPEGVRIGALIPIGYPAEEPAAPKRKDVDMLLAFR